MKKIPKFKWILFMIGLLLIGGCGKSPDWQVSLIASGELKEGESLPLTLEVKKKGQPVHGLHIDAVLEMQRMNHGTVEVQFTEKGEGVYEGSAILSMPGDWTGNLVISDTKHTDEVSINFTVVGSERK